MSESKPKKGNRMVVKTVRLTPESHELVATLADLLNVSMSEAVEMAIKRAFPNTEDEAVRRQQWKDQQLQEKSGKE